MSTRHEVAEEIRKVKHIFDELGRKYELMISEKSKLPVLVIAPHGSTGLFTPCVTWNKEIEHMYTQLQERPVLQVSDIPQAEMVAHTLRGSALHKANASRRTELFDRAYTLYRSILFQCAHTSLTAMLNDEAKMNTRIRVFSPVPDLHQMPTTIRRLISHCLGGMALCALMGKGNPILFFGLTSMAIGWEPFHQLELVNFLRLNLLLTGMFHLGLVQIQNDGEFVVMSMEEADKLMQSPLMSIPAVYKDINKKLVLPMVIRNGSKTMLEHEKDLIPADEWDKVCCTHCHLHQMLTPHNGRPTPSPYCSTSAWTTGRLERYPTQSDSRPSTSSTTSSPNANVQRVGSGRPTPPRSSSAAANAGGCTTAARSVRGTTGRSTRAAVACDEYVGSTLLQ